MPPIYLPAEFRAPPFLQTRSLSNPRAHPFRQGEPSQAKPAGHLVKTRLPAHLLAAAHALLPYYHLFLISKAFIPIAINDLVSLLRSWTSPVAKTDNIFASITYYAPTVSSFVPERRPT